MSRAGFLLTWCLELRIVFLCLGAFFNSMCVFMCLHRGEDWVWPHRHKAQIGGVLQWCLFFCRFLPSAYMIMELNKDDHQVLGHQSRQGPSPSIAQFGWVTSSWMSPGRPFFHSRIMETTMLLGTFSAAEIFCCLPQICASIQSCLLSSAGSSFTSWLGFRSDIHCQLWGLL